MTRRRRVVSEEDCPYCNVRRGFPCLNYKRQPKAPCDFVEKVSNEDEAAEVMRQTTIDDYLRDKERKG